LILFCRGYLLLSPLLLFLILLAPRSITGVIEGRQDISGGRRVEDVRTAKNSTWGKAFNSLCYTADGSAILAGGNSKYVCIYDVRSRILLKKFQTTHNRSLDGVLDYLNSKVPRHALHPPSLPH